MLYGTLPCRQLNMWGCRPPDSVLPSLIPSVGKRRCRYLISDHGNGDELPFPSLFFVKNRLERFQASVDKSKTRPAANNGFKQTAEGGATAEGGYRNTGKWTGGKEQQRRRWVGTTELVGHIIIWLELPGPASIISDIYDRYHAHDVVIIWEL